MTRKLYTIFGVIFGILIVLVGLLNKKNFDTNTIVINDSILNNFYLANRNLEDPAFIHFNNLSEIQIALVRDDYIKREVLKREALNWGLVNKVVPLSELEKESVIWSQKILDKSPTALRLLKASLNADCDGQAGLQQLAGDATMLFYMTEEAQEGRDAFKEKRKPNFKKFKRYP